MATIQERTDTNGRVRYRVQIRLRGHPAQSATFDRKTDAKLWAQKTEAAIREGRHFERAESKRHTLAQMIDRYVQHVLPTKRPNSQKTQRLQLLWWKEQLGHYRLADITPALIAQYRDVLAGETTCRHTQRSPSTTARYLAALSHAFSVAMREWGWVEDNPLRRVRKPREPRGRVRFLSDDERARLLAACRESKNECLYDVVVVALSTGMRKSEILGLTWEDVDFQRRIVVLHDTKNNERRAVPVVGHAFDVLQERYRTRRDDTPFVFPGPRRYGKPARIVDIRAAFVAAVERAGIQDFRFHDLRHSCASYLAMNGATLAEIAEVLGHKTLSMVRRYAHLSEAHTSRVVEAMNKRMFDGVETTERE